MANTPTDKGAHVERVEDQNARVVSGSVEPDFTIEHWTVPFGAPAGTVAFRIVPKAPPATAECEGVQA